MNKRSVLYALGTLLLFLAAALVAPTIVAALYERLASEGDLVPFAVSVAVTAVAGLATRRLTRGAGELRHREGFAVVALGWVTIALFGALPFLLHRVFQAPGRGIVDEFVYCFFESMSGFTTTGATVLTDIEGLPHGILFWRSLTHWLGGMGIVVLAVAILPMLGVGGMQLYRAEAPGPQTDRLTPRITQTAKLMWAVYVLFSAAEALLLWAGGMTAFDALCHTFGTMATGGFATKNLSIGHYDSVYFELVITLFMLIAGTNFALHYRALRGDFRAYWRDAEFRFYCLMFGASVLILTVSTLTGDGSQGPVYRSPGPALRFSVFQSASILTTTGYGTFDFELWPALSQLLLVILMFFGGCAGSTGGGMKHVRFLLLIKHGYSEVRRFILPRAVLPVRMNGAIVPPDVMKNILGFFFLFISILAIATCLMAALGLDMITAFGSVIATMGNIGPGLGSVGPMDNYAAIPVLGQVVLSFCMLIGRLELYTVLVLFAPQLWKR